MSPWRILKLTGVYQVAALSAFSLGCVFLWPKVAVAVVVGGVFGALNFASLKSLVQRTFADVSKPRYAYLTLLAAKMVLAMGVMTLLIVVVGIDPIGFALGLATMFVGLVLALGHVMLTPTESKA